MGIPSYFSHIIRNYEKIVRGIEYFKNGQNLKQNLNNLFLDCNSIIYDAVYSFQKTEQNNMDKEDFENKIIDIVIENVKKYIEIIRPNNTVYIAFDGVAPFAKMEQQRTRRYKSNYMSNLPFIDKKTSWDTSSITPGTHFMEHLSKRVTYAFQNQELKYGVKKIVVSCSDEAGEGEHKITEYMRNFGENDETVALYGLDADLIMLSMFHLRYYSNIYVFREAPEFIKNSIHVESGNDTNNLYFLDISAFSNCLLSEMDCLCYDKQRIYDYVFMCFLLGNDFMPHFPALNIRTHGIQVLMDIYRLHVGNIKDRFFISREGKIQWKVFGDFVREIANREQELIKNEYFIRDKFDKYQFAHPSNAKEKEELLQNSPIIYRAEEKYICPDESGWESRYYKSLLPNVEKKSVCNNYLEGLEWTFKYYSSGCPDWKWSYHYHYPPLFIDLVSYIPRLETEFILENSNGPFSPFTQLAYVLPKSNLDLLPEKMKRFLKDNYSELYTDTYEFQWAFCRYFWEAHPLLPEVPMTLLEQWDTQFKMSCIVR
jgi:5'-3' exonuclease